MIDYYCGYSEEERENIVQLFEEEFIKLPFDDVDNFPNLKGNEAVVHLKGDYWKLLLHAVPGYSVLYIMLFHDANTIHNNRVERDVKMKNKFGIEQYRLFSAHQSAPILTTKWNECAKAYLKSVKETVLL